MSTHPAHPALTTAQGERPASRVIRRLIPFLKPYSGRIGIAMAFLLTAKVAGLAVPMLLKHLIDTLGLPNTLAVIPVALVIAYGYFVYTNLPG